MVLLAFLALALAGVAVAALLRLLTLSRTRIAANLDDVGAYGYAAVGSTVAPEQSAEVAGPLAALAGRLGELVAGRMGPAREDTLRKLLIAAGMYSTSVRRVLGYRVLTALMLGGLGAMMGPNVVQRVIVAALLGACGWRLPIVYLGRRARQRALQIDREIPNLIDQLVVSLEAGIGFSAALRTSANRLGGPLGEEMRLTLQEQRMGASLTYSLVQLRERVNSTNLGSFVRAVVQGERLGVSIGQVMRDLAVEMRKRRRQMAEEQAQKTPVKLLLPLVFLILPTIFVVVLVPPMLTLVKGL
ncbi:MAG TPA: type II secretion system F family protein [Solirubrobacteraceae bacterium]|nr:type II secretion system F family protein [Solirubrobacteraceae bacterium]